MPDYGWSYKFNIPTSDAGHRARVIYEIRSYLETVTADLSIPFTFTPDTTSPHGLWIEARWTYEEGIIDITVLMLKIQREIDWLIVNFLIPVKRLSRWERLRIPLV